MALFDAGEILPLEVFDQGDLRDVPLDKDAGKRQKSGVLGGPVPAFARDDDRPGAIGRHPEQDRLDDPLYFYLLLTNRTFVLLWTV
jgi:hypothetical protein